ncbi:Uncharacterised protein [Enterococcus durans]|uniref:hypothetical protein n=1 Tax=Enterococcus TaxID=1350 RepID=UPI000DFEE2BA|nr:MULTISPECIES: hypothetical protein [Enterococcus]MDO1599893.1 hypothetical protein [Enterococcus faecium]NHB73513.1 hypothetical protein [Enterococcus faecium]STP37569.1 Uncharacterised protein [Enterococcus durans]STP39529.1 Uncharacterised protein [Enterococcus durans]
MNQNSWLEVMNKMGIDKEELKEILSDEGVMRALQRKSFEYSTDFFLDTISDEFIKEHCALEAMPLLRKKLAEHLMVAVCLKRRKSDKSLLDLLIRNSSYSYYPTSFYWTPIFIYTNPVRIDEVVK